MSNALVIISKDQSQVWLDTINNAIYSQLTGAKVPYTLYRYYVGGTIITENKMILLPVEDSAK